MSSYNQQDYGYQQQQSQYGQMGGHKPLMQGYGHRMMRGYGQRRMRGYGHRMMRGYGHRMMRGYGHRRMRGYGQRRRRGFQGRRAAQAPRQVPFEPVGNQLYAKRRTIYAHTTAEDDEDEYDGDGDEYALDAFNAASELESMDLGEEENHLGRDMDMDFNGYNPDDYDDNEDYDFAKEGATDSAPAEPLDDDD